MYPDADIDPEADINIDYIDYYEPPIVRDPEDILILDAFNKMSAKEFNDWVKEWIKKT